MAKRLAHPKPAVSEQAQTEETKPAVSEQGAPAPVAVLTVEPRRVYVDFQCPDGMCFRAQGTITGGQTFATSDFSPRGGGRVMLAVPTGAEVRVRVQTSGLQRERSAWIDVGTVTTPKSVGLTRPPAAAR